MIENQPGGNKILFAKKDNTKKEYLYNTFEFLELERNLMGIVDEEDMNPCIMGSPSTVDSTNLFQDINNNQKEQLSLKENKKELQQKFFISSVLRENWADYAARFKFNIFDTILREKKLLEKKANPGFKKAHSNDNSPFVNSLDPNKQLINHLKNNRHLYELN